MWLYIIAALVLAFSPVDAAELVDIVSAHPCSLIPGDSVGASGNCAASTDGKSLSVRLTARQVDLSAHPEDEGKVTLELPDGVSFPGSTSQKIAVNGLMLYNESLAPEVWRINAGRTLDVRLVNRLVPGERAATNLHTHGLLVSPDLDTRAGRAVEPVGDTVYVCTIPEGSDPSSPSAKYCAAHGAYYGAKTSEMNYRYRLPADHPEGLFWYHPHVHMNARTQVGAGLSGLIFIKNGSDNRSGGARTAGGMTVTERFLMLKDIQVGDIAASDPGLLRANFLSVEQHDAQLCGTGQHPPHRGVCFNGTNGALYTVNGQLFPHMTVKAGGKEIWRIANTSADMTYDLALVERYSGAPLRMQIIARDGVAAAQEGGNDAILVERVLLMPSSRIEVAIDRSTTEGLYVGTDPLEAVLKSFGYYTGGDAWPSVELASVTFEATPVPSSNAVATATNEGIKRTKREMDGKGAVEKRFTPLIVKPWTPSPNGVEAVRLQRQDASVDRRSNSDAVTTHTHSEDAMAARNEHPLPLPSKQECKPLGTGEERIIALAINKTGGNDKFKIGTVRVKPSALTPAEWDAAVQKAIDASREFGNGSQLLCAHAGTTEIWTIANKPFQDNQETHNFHIHQTKFEVLKVTDPNGRIEAPRGGPAAKRLVDNYPVPIGGSIRIKIHFLDQQAGGRFVFHCHILEHEDNGMMAEIEVMPRKIEVVDRVAPR